MLSTLSDNVGNFRGVCPSDSGEDEYVPVPVTVFEAKYADLLHGRACLF